MISARSVCSLLSSPLGSALSQYASSPLPFPCSPRRRSHSRAERRPQIRHHSFRQGHSCESTRWSPSQCCSQVCAIPLIICNRLLTSPPAGSSVLPPRPFSNTHGQISRCSTRTCSRYLPLFLMDMPGTCLTSPSSSSRGWVPTTPR